MEERGKRVGESEREMEVVRERVGERVGRVSDTEREGVRAGEGHGERVSDK